MGSGEGEAGAEESYWGSDRQVYRRPEATEVSFARLNFLRSADDRVKLKKVSERIRKERSGMTEEDIVEEYRRMKSLIIRHDQAT